MGTINGFAELSPRMKFDVFVPAVSRMTRSLPKNTVVGYAKRNSTALITPFCEAGEQYALILQSLFTASPPASATIPINFSQQ